MRLALESSQTSDHEYNDMHCKEPLMYKFFNFVIRFLMYVPYSLLRIVVLFILNLHKM